MSVYERPKGSGHWYLYVVVNGKKIRRSIKEARTRRQAERAERVLRDEIFENRYGEGGQKLFSDFVEKSYKPYAQEHKRGFKIELSILNVLLDKFGKLKLFEITPEAVEKFKRERATEITNRGTIRSKSTVNRDVAVLAAVFNLAKDFGEIKNNPVSNVKYYTNLNSRDRVLSEEEEAILFDRIKGDVRFTRQVEILLYTGMRRGELFNIEWRDIDLTEGFIYLRKEITKTGKARTVPMLSNVQRILEELRAEAGDALITDKIFSGITWDITKLTTNFRKVCDELGFNDLVIHSLRHTFSTRADKYKVGTFAQQGILGHAKLKQTSDYTHPSKETLKENVLGFEKYIAQRKK